MLTRGRCLDLWKAARLGCDGFSGTNVETVVAFARLVEATSLENAVRGLSVKNRIERRNMLRASPGSFWAGYDDATDALRARARAVRAAVEQE